MSTSFEPIALTVDGHDFLVRARLDEPGVYDFQWLTGPPDYGFTMASSEGSPMSAGDAEDAIRDFLAQVDPVTGYIE